MRLLPLFFFFFCCLSLAQSYNDKRTFINTQGEYIRPEPNTVAEYEAKGNVKNIKLKEISYQKYDTICKAYLKTDGDYVSGLFIEFNLNHKLTTLSFLNEDGSTALMGSHLYNDAGMEIQNAVYYWDSLESVEKNVYDKDRLTEIWAKSNKQNSFFLKGRFTYNDKGQIIKQENLNSNLEAEPFLNGSAGYPSRDVIYYYAYDNDLLVRCDAYVFEYDSKSRELHDEKDFVWNSTNKIKYYNGKKKVSIVTAPPYPGSHKKYKRKSAYNYDVDNNLISYRTLYGPTKRPLDFLNFHYTNKKLDFIEDGYNDRISKKTYFKNDKVWKVEEFYYDGRVDYNYYDENGELTKEVSGDDTTEYKFQYDSKGNWIKLSTLRNGVLIEDRTRVIEYYD